MICIELHQKIIINNPHYGVFWFETHGYTKGVSLSQRWRDTNDMDHGDSVRKSWPLEWSHFTWNHSMGQPLWVDMLDMDMICIKNE